MHHALHIEEVLLNIFGYCDTLVYQRWRSPFPRRKCCYANSHLVALARTCRTFREPALDMIWSELDDLTPLVRCLPKELWVVSGPEHDGAPSVYSLDKPLGQAEWDIILGYARRVQSLPHLRGSLGLTAESIKMLSKPPVTGSIFSRLRIVALREPSVAVVPLIRHLAHSQVTNILLWHPEILGATVDAFGSGCPFTTDFYASQWANSDLLSTLVCCWKFLRSVDCGNISLNIHALTHLSRLRNLTDLSLETNDAVADQILAASSLASTFTFPALQDLSLNSTSLTPIWRFIRHFRLPMIHALYACLLSRPTTSDLMAFFVSLQEACSHDLLENLTLRVYRQSGSMIQSPPLFHVTFERLRPLTVFTNIQSITLNIPCGVDVNEHELLTLASSWPHLVVFEVASNHDWTPSSALTPEGFLRLLEKCRSLRVLHFTFDTRGYTDIPQGHPWRGLRMPKNAFIHLLNSPIDEGSIEALGVFFHVAPYPSFGLTTHWNNSFYQGGERPQELCDLYYDRWVRARNLACDLWMERRDLRRDLEARSLQQ